MDSGPIDKSMAEHPRDLAVYERSPTLIAGEDGSSQGPHGPVRVWTPPALYRWSNAVLAWVGAAVFLGAAAALISLHRMGIVSLGCGGLGLMLVGFGVDTVMKPPYAVTDETGLAITAGRKTWRFRWNEIECCIPSHYDGRGSQGRYVPFTLVLEGGVSETPTLDGYSQKTEQELTALVIWMAGLRQDPDNPWHYVRPHRPLNNPEDQ